MSSIARELGARLTIDVPKDAPRAKLDRLRGPGITIVADCANYDEAEARALSAAAAGDGLFISAYNHPDIIAGAGTIAASSSSPSRGTSSACLAACAAGPRVLDRWQQKRPEFGHDLGKRLESAQLISCSNGLPVRLCALVLHELVAEPDNLAVRERRLSAAERGPERGDQCVTVERPRSTIASAWRTPPAQP